LRDENARQITILRGRPSSLWCSLYIEMDC